MKELKNIYKESGRLHHAYLLLGLQDELVSELLEFLESSFGLTLAGNPDVLQMNFQTLVVEDARTISSMQERKSYGLIESGAPKIFIIKADTITEEAQNSLLKVFEEPTTGTHFFLLMPQDCLLPTLRSRMQIISRLTKMNFVSTKAIFASASLAERLALVKDLTTDISDEKKTKQEAIDLVNEIEVQLYRDGEVKNSKSLEACEKARICLFDRGAPIKMILENLMMQI